MSSQLSTSLNRIISARMMVTEKRIDELIALLDGPSKSSMYEIENDLDTEGAVTMLTRLKEAKQFIGHIADEYGLTKDIKPLSRIISVTRSMIWQDLIDTNSTKLTGFGKLVSGAPDSLNGDIAKLLELTEKLAGIE